jgi:hypothetical protein
VVGSPLVQEKYQEEKVCGGNDDDKMIKIILTEH